MATGWGSGSLHEREEALNSVTFPALLVVQTTVARLFSLLAVHLTFNPLRLRLGVSDGSSGIRGDL